jgi:threonylcarbamoyladenosine tRNA methylthiotransferase MtaB
MKRKVAFKTLGCRLNQFETDALLTDFYNAGYEVVDFKEAADVYIVNSCTVTNQGDHKSNTYINQAIRNRNGSLVLVTGCMAESRKEYLESRGDITYVVGNANKSQLLSLVEAHFNGEMPHPGDLKKDLFNFTVAEKSFHTRSMIKIQDGCDNFCSYCIVPLVRGAAVSRRVNDILDHIRKLVDLGFKEVVLTGVNISRYEYGDVGFAGLVEKMLGISGDFRIRISSIEPEGLGDGFIELFSHEKLCPHLHLCLQSGSDKVLQRMKRNNTVGEFYALTDKLRKKHPLFNFTTDIIVGFPGETQKDFEDTCRVARDIGFSHIHTFRFSVRKGTRASTMPEQVDEKIKKQRSEVIRQLSEDNKMQYCSRFIGKKQTVLVEKVTRQGYAKGFGEHYLPVEFRPNRAGNNYFAEILVREVNVAANEILRGIRPMI